MGDKPKYGEPITMLPNSEAARDFIRNTVKTKNLKLGCLVTARRTIEETLCRVREPWDFVYFMRLQDSSFEALKAVSAECKKLNKPLFAYFLVGTAKNVETVKMIGWPTAATMETVEEKASQLVGLVDGIIATCAGDAEGDKLMLQKLQKFRN